MVRLHTKNEFNPILFILYNVAILLCTKNVSGRQPNIIFIIADDLGWNDVGFHGENAIPTPNIDSLAYNGLILNRHYTLPTCTPSRAALLTGRYPFRYGIERPIGAGVPEAVPVTEKLLPQYLKELGYATHLIGKWHLGCHREELLPQNRGYDSHIGYWNGYLNFNDSVHHSMNARGFDARHNMKEYAAEMSSKYLTDFLTDESVKIIKSHNQTKPLFLQFSHAAVHTAHMGTADQEAGVLQVPDEGENNKTFEHISNPNRRLFAGILKSLDDSVGRVIESLDEANMLENSFVVFISDNGGSTADTLYFHGNTGSNWPLRGAKYSVYEGGVRNIAVVWSPLFNHLTKGYVSDDLMHLTDWLPALYNIAGGDKSKLPNDLDGEDPWDLMMDSRFLTQPRNTILVALNSEYNDEALIYHQWKLVKVNTSKTMAFAHIHYNRTTSDDSMYDIDRILSSKANLILSKYQSSRTMMTLTNDFVKQIRSDLRIDCKERTPVETNCCMDRYCLYDIFEDPCEYKNKANDHPEIVEELKYLLDQYKRQGENVTAQIGSFEEIANPMYWHGYWSPWKDRPIYLWVNEAIMVLGGTLVLLIYISYVVYKKIL